MKNHILEIFLDFCTVLGSLGGALLLYSWLIRHVFRKWNMYRKINRLSASVVIDYFVGILGAPAFIYTHDDSKRYVFVDKLFYVGAITDLNNAIIAFSVTTRKKHFNPILKIGPYSLSEKAIKIKLGKSRFSELNRFQGKVSSSAGARRAWYIETYYFGNPGNYQTYGFSLNDGGFRDTGSADSIYNLGANETTDSRIQDFRNQAVINTYTITQPHYDGDVADASPDYDQVRIMT